MNTLGAKPYQLFWRITLPNAVPVMFSGLRLGLIYALLGVVGTEIIASQHDIRGGAHIGSMPCKTTVAFARSRVRPIRHHIALVCR